ncbi:universal stress protein [Streptacidiphilus jiangxiensis]|uniref:Nucleotide-binding universal stress protein, UspA family n=1 Tax=Streptacidiphilus jiangxiensis TaxID=235985 RepID=A0A1H7QTF1_STRJI|nr:universal stress protein [Streptacidiphilus jiangxiensis]SEL50988.1 Nucleotide-binding universal stress protein, UspA family [Streptacidiphilus jiangxiensis]
MNSSPTEAVVVGLDTSENARVALEWAADEAHLRGAVLRVGHAWSMQAYRLPEAYKTDIREDARKAAWTFLESAAEDMRKRHPGLEVEPELIDEAAVEGLLRMAANDSGLLVTGRRGLNPFMTVLLGSVSEGVAAHTPVPAVLVPTEGAPDPRGPVVVGVAPGEPEPVEFAFAEAERRGVVLKVVRTWMYPQAFPGHVAVPPQEEARRTAEETAELEKLLAPARAAHPKVEVAVRIELGLAEEAVVNASKDASLVVVGAHRKHTQHFSLPIGRVPHRVLHLAHAPVAVVPH